MTKQANGGRTQERTQNLDSKVPPPLQARMSTHESDTDLERAVAASREGDLRMELILRTANLIQDWAFWRWLGRRSQFIPWEAYEGLRVSANGRIVDVGVCTIAAAYQRVVNNRPDLSVTPGSTLVWWKNFVSFTQAEAMTRNVLKGKGGR